jgi:hypothetical protein
MTFKGYHLTNTERPLAGLACRTLLILLAVGPPMLAGAWTLSHSPRGNQFRQ